MGTSDKAGGGTHENRGAKRRPRAWWQWVLGIGLLAAACVSVVMRYVPGFAPMVSINVPPREIRVSRELKPADAVPARPGALAGCNLLFVTVDTTRADRIGCYGNTKIDTPALDRLAREGVLFSNATAATPVTLPSHSTMMTGLYPYHHGVRANNWFSLGEDHYTLAEALAANGYSTGAFVSAFVLDSRYGLSQGFDHYDDEVEMDTGMQKWVHLVPERRGNATVDRAEQWLRQRGDEKFFAWVHLYDPHFPYNPPEPYASKYKLPYDAEIAFADAQVGRLLGILDELGLTDNTLVVVAGDHGESLGQHGEPTHGLLIYGATTNVPLVMRCGRRLGGGAHVSRPVSQVDIMPTVLSLLGIETSQGVDGVDLTRPATEGRALFAETLQGLYEHNVAPLLGVRVGSAKYIHGPEPELYDLAADPFERENLASSKQQETSTLRDRLTELFGDDLEQAGSAKPTREVSADEMEKLAALGYVGGGFSGVSAPGARVSPAEALRDMREFAMLISDTADEEDPDAALERLKEFARTHPNNYQALRALSDAYLNAGEFEQAEEVLRKLLEERPDSPQVIQSMAALCLSQRQIEEAITWYTLLLKNTPNHLPSLRTLGELHLARGEFAKASEILRRAFESNAADETVPDELASAMATINQVDPAIELFEQALAKNPNLPMVRNALARLLSGKGQYAEAVELLRVGIELAPEALELPNNLSFILANCPDAEVRQPFEAIAILERLCRDTGYEDPRFMNSLAMVYAGVWRVDEALAIARKAHKIALASDNPAYAQLAALLGQSIASYERMKEEGPPTTQASQPAATSQAAAAAKAPPANGD